MRVDTPNPESSGGRVYLEGEGDEKDVAFVLKAVLARGRMAIWGSRRAARSLVGRLEAGTVPRDAAGDVKLGYFATIAVERAMWRADEHFGDNQPVTEAVARLDRVDPPSSTSDYEGSNLTPPWD